MAVPFRIPATSAALAAFLFAGAAAQAQEDAFLSFSSAVTAPWGTLFDTEIVRWDAAGARVRPWLSAASGAFFLGDADGDGDTDEWKDVDALHVTMTSVRVAELVVSFNSTTGPWLDGDLVRVRSDGTLEAFVSEAQLVAALGLSDGQVDVDGLHVDVNGRIYLSFADDEASSLLSTDAANVVTDGSIVSLDAHLQNAQVELTEAQADAMVTAALGATTKAGDVTGIAMDAQGVLAFSVQSPSADDASVFRVSNGGERILAESALGLTGTVEIDALELQAAPAPFLAGRATPRVVAGGQQLALEVEGEPGHSFVALLSLGRIDAAAVPGGGFVGLFLDPGDPLFAASLRDFAFTAGTTDAAGRASLLFDAAPPGVAVTLWIQLYDFDGRTFGMPMAIELTG